MVRFPPAWACDHAGVFRFGESYGAIQKEPSVQEIAHGRGNIGPRWVSYLADIDDMAFGLT